MKKTGRKWRAMEETEKFISILEHDDIVGSTQKNTSGLRNPQFKSFKDMNNKKRRLSVVIEVLKELVQCSQQGKCVSWQDKTVDRVIKWSDFWKRDPASTFSLHPIYS